MSISTKYGRTYHYDFSPGTTSDDRINREWWEDIQKLKQIIHLEKMDGENTCLNGIGIFARSHAAPTTHPWSSFLKQKYSMIQSDLKNTDIEIFGENLYAMHSIVYPNLDSHFQVFAVRHHDKWLGWEEVKWYAEIFDFPTVPEILVETPTDRELLKKFVIENSAQPSFFGSLQNDYSTNREEGAVLNECTKEGIVSRNFDEFSVNDFKSNVFKYVRKGHVNTNTHWSRNWQRAALITDNQTNKI